MIVGDSVGLTLGRGFEIYARSHPDQIEVRNRARKYCPIGRDLPAQAGFAQPVLDALATRVIHVGARGSGAAAKLAVNSLVHGLNIALSEALVLAERAGVDRTTAYEVFASGAAGAPFVQYKRAAYEHPETTAVAFSLDLVAKDLELITGLGARVGAPKAQAETGLELVRQAIAAEDGVLFKKIGDAAQAAFPSVPAAVRAAIAAQRALAAADFPAVGPLPVRMAIHIGDATPVEGDYLVPALWFVYGWCLGIQTYLTFPH